MFFRTPIYTTFSNQTFARTVCTFLSLFAYTTRVNNEKYFSIDDATPTTKNWQIFILFTTYYLRDTGQTPLDKKFESSSRKSNYSVKFPEAPGEKIS